MRKLVLVCAVLAAAVLFADPTSDLEKVKKLEDALVKVVAKASKAFVNFRIGSGVCISPDGLVVTNDHVARHSRNWTVFMPDEKTGRSFKAKILWRDPFGDITVLKLDTGGKKVPYVELGDSDAVKIGQFVFALGTPFQTANADNRPTVTFGVISANHRMMGNYTDCIQTDCPVNPGNSGGPLLDMKGRLLGINGQIRVRFPYRVNTGIGLAVPVNRIKRFLKAFKNVTDGRVVQHGTIKGLVLKGAPGDFRAVFRAKPEPAVVTDVQAGSTAAAAGFHKGDTILKIDDYKVVNNIRFWGRLWSYPAGWEVKITVLRGGKQVVLAVKLDPLGVLRRRPGPRPQPPQPQPPAVYMGVVLMMDKGKVTVARVKKDSPADKAGLKEGDVILKFDGKKLESVAHFMRLLSHKKPGDTVELEIERKGEKLKLKVKLSKRP